MEKEIIDLVFIIILLTESLISYGRADKNDHNSNH